MKTSTTYDIITIGGGLGGSVLAKAMAEHGARVLVLESQTRFGDRVRGEAMMPWGAAEARELGVYDTLMASGGHELLWWDSYQGAKRTGHRELATTTVPGVPVIACYHPTMQEALIEAAAGAGAEVRRGARVRGIKFNGAPTVLADVDGSLTELKARFVVAADGRSSMARKWGGFDIRRHPDQVRIAGVLLDNVPVPDQAAHIWPNPHDGLMVYIFPQGNERVRSYLCYPTDAGYRLSGEADLPRFVEESLKAGVPAEYYAKAKIAGPLATFEGAAVWVEHPYRHGVGLVGDAAAASDPTWGQGLSLTLRDVRVLRDQLIRHENWDEAGEAYAEEHDRYCGVLLTFESWITQMLLETGPEADARRARALPLWREDRTRQPDIGLSGPDQTLDEAARRRFFGED